MTRLAVTIHDAGLLATRADGRKTPAPEPGYALEEGGQLLLGRAALARARLLPRHVHPRFWSALSTADLPRPWSRGLTTADLAHAQLGALWKKAGDGVESVALVVPGCFSNEQLGLLLSLARSWGMPVGALVDAAVASAVAVARETPPGAQVLHLDLQLHRAVLSELRPEASSGGLRQIVRHGIEIDDGTGLAVLRDAWARRVAARFVDVTRFDPLHAGPAEQELYDRLPEWLAVLAAAESVEARLGSGASERTVELFRDDLLAAARPFYERLLELVRGVKQAGRHATVLLSATAAELPGLPGLFADWRDVTVLELAHDAPARGTLASWNVLPEAGEALSFVVRLPLPPAAGAREPRRTVPGRVPTHVVYKWMALRLGERPWIAGHAPPAGERGLCLPAAAGVAPRHLSLLRRAGKVFVEDHAGGTWLNGEPVDGGAELRAGDVLRLGGRDGTAPELLLVTETEEEAAEAGDGRESADGPPA